MSYQWTIADRISDTIVEAINYEIEAMRKRGNVDPIQALVGQLLALKSLDRSIPASRPKALAILMSNVDTTLAQIFAVYGNRN